MKGFIKYIICFAIWFLYLNKLNAQILPQLRSVDCSRTNISQSLLLYANLTGGVQYKFEVTNTTLGLTDSLISADRAFSLSELPLVSRYNCSFNVRVRIDFGSGFGGYGPVCTVTTAPLITQLRSVDCPRNLIWLNTIVYAAQTTADSWDFEVRLQSDPATSEIVSGRPNREFQLTMTISPAFQQFGTVYEVRCRTTQGGVIQPWGSWCTITSPSTSPPLITSGCGNTFEYLAYEYLTCTNIPSATKYRWRLRIGSTFVDTVNTLTNQVRICDFLDNSNLPMYDYGQTYNISAEAFDGISWTGYGSGCVIYTTSQPHAEVYQPINPCGSTLASLNTPIYVYAIFNATNYKYEVTDLTGGPYSDGVQILNKPTKSFKLNELTNYSYGHNYQIRCAVTFKGIEYGYSQTCTLNAPAPIVTLRPADCPKTLTTLSQLFYANNTLTFDNTPGLDPVNTYRFKVNGIESPWQSSRAINLQTILGAAPAYNTAYTVYVKVTYDGVEQPYGNGCVITTPIAISLDSNLVNNEIKSSKTENVSDFVVYPNPSDDYFLINYNGEIGTEDNNDITLSVRNLNGQEIWSGKYKSCDLGGVRIGEDWNSGLYFLEMRDSHSNLFRKSLIKH